MTTQIRITAHVARRLLRAVVAETGQGYVNRDGCTYVDVAGVGPHCLVGRVLHRAGVTVDELSEMDRRTPTDILWARLPRRVVVTWPARLVLDRAQAVQDAGHAWGYALAEALRVRPWQVTA